MLDKLSSKFDILIHKTSSSEADIRMQINWAVEKNEQTVISDGTAYSGQSINMDGIRWHSKLRNNCLSPETPVVGGVQPSNVSR